MSPTFKPGSGLPSIRSGGGLRRRPFV
jgi:hypothetical protein